MGTWIDRQLLTLVTEEKREKAWLGSSVSRFGVGTWAYPFDTLAWKVKISTQGKVFGISHISLRRDEEIDVWARAPHHRAARSLNNGSEPLFSFQARQASYPITHALNNHNT